MAGVIFATVPSLQLLTLYLQVGSHTRSPAMSFDTGLTLITHWGPDEPDVMILLA